MIGRLHGTLLSKQPNHMVIDVQGVGYEVDISFTTFSALPELHQITIIHTHLTVREDAHLLYGFAELRERALFRLLIKINGVGPKMALAILSSMEAPALAACVQSQDIATMIKVPGVGKKTAERLLIELRDKINEWLADSVGQQSIGESSGVAVNDNASMDAESALINLGYKPAVAAKAIAKACREQPLAASEELIRLALRNM